MGTKRADIEGKRFGKLYVVGYDHTNKWKESVWKCKCDCGAEVLVTAKCLNRGTKSCGCIKKVIKYDLSDQVFGDWTVLHRDAEIGKSYWICKCRHGKIRSIQGAQLRNGNRARCGCSEKVKSTKPKRKFHGGSKLPLYKRWSDMIQRCTNKNNERYKDYGGRGITVCDEWRDFSTFRAWAEENGYSKSLQLDRIDNDRGYSPENCRFVTPKENAGHRRVTAYMECDGRRQSIAAWSRETGISYDTIRARRLNGWDDERALKTPVIKKNKQQNEGG